MAEMATKSGLDRQTKAELINIILRKDSVHQELNQRIEDLVNTNVKLTEDNEQLLNAYDTTKKALENERQNVINIRDDNEKLRKVIENLEHKCTDAESLQDVVDDLTAINTELDANLLAYKISTFVFAALFVVDVIINAILFFCLIK